MNQDYTNYSFLIHAEHPKIFSPNQVKTKYLNCSANRNQARRLALASDAEYFLFVDSDMAFPKHTIKELICHRKPVVGGWYKINGGTAYVGGRFVADNMFEHFRSPSAHVIRTDLVGLGCCLIRRDVLEKVKFKHGLDLVLNTTRGKELFAGECLQFSNDVYDLFKYDPKFSLYLDGHVVCNHFPRE